MNLSKFGQKFTADSGILELMDDLGKAMSGMKGSDKKVYMLGGGNPAHIPEVQKIFRKNMMNILSNGKKFEDLIGNYDTAQGDIEFLEAIAEFLNQKFDWALTSQNIAVTNGSQSGFFVLFNMLAGEQSNGSKKKILLPIAPEYIGYADQGLSEDFFIAIKPEIEFLNKHTFKYKINFEKLDKYLKKNSSSTAGICISRPTNPTGNVITNEEIEKLNQLSKKYEIPLIIDNAYGQPFPGIIFTDAQPTWNENMVLTMSLSKLGMPSIRTGIIIANKQIITAITKINSILTLSHSRIAQAIVTPLLKNRSIDDISNNLIRPFYEKKSKQAQKFVKKYFDDSLPYYIHKSEGSLFLWAWFRDLPISSYELYNRLKKRNVIVVPGHYFYPGFDEEWQQKHECIRISFAMSEKNVEQGIKIISEEIKKAYKS